MPIEKTRHRGPSAITIRRLRSRREKLVTSVVSRFSEDHSWYRDLSTDHRLSINMVVQSAVATLADWCDDPYPNPKDIAAAISVAPPELARSISLQHTLELVRTGVDVIEEEAEMIAAPGNEHALQDAIVRFSREFALAAAEVYAHAVQMRSAWDVRAEANVVEDLLLGKKGPVIRSRAASLGWTSEGPMISLAAKVDGPLSPEKMIQLRRIARNAVPDVMLSSHADRLYALLGGPGDLREGAEALAAALHSNQVVVGPIVSCLDCAPRTLQSCATGLNALPGWPDAPTPVRSSQLLPERIMLGDEFAKTSLMSSIFRPLMDSGDELVATLDSYLSHGRSLEATSRALYVHPNTVRYRLRKVVTACQLDPTKARDAFVLQTALAMGRIA